MEEIIIKDFKNLVDGEKNDWLMSFVETNFPDLSNNESYLLAAELLGAIDNCKKPSLTEAALKRIRNNFNNTDFYSREDTYGDFDWLARDDDNAERKLSAKEEKSIFKRRQAEYEQKASLVLSPILLEAFLRFINEEAEVKLTAEFSDSCLKILYRQAYLRLQWKD